MTPLVERCAEDVREEVVGNFGADDDWDWWEEDDESGDPALALTPAEQQEEENVFEEMSERSRTFEVTSEISKIRIATAPEVQAGGKLDTVVEAVKVDAAVYAGRLARARVTNAQRRSDESKRVSADGC